MCVQKMPKLIFFSIHVEVNLNELLLHVSANLAIFGSDPGVLAVWCQAII